ncbi:UNVERIFIED_CONTAM: hypothetical protein GTU68_036395 [Idotea baltica]|nr:hypothetical protein [Idotea baltica]
MSSINTNNSAMVALQTLKSINSNLSDTQSAISTGKDVNSAKDNASVWAISKVMESDVSGLDAVTDSLAVGQSAVAVASAGAELIVDTIKEMQALAISAQSESANFVQIDAEMSAKKDQLDAIVAGSQFNGVNLLNTDTGSLNRIGGGAATATTIDVASADLETTVTGITLTGTADTADAAATYDELTTMLTAAITGAAALGTSAKRLEDQSNFVSKLSDSLTSGVGALVDSDMEAQSAKLQALQTQQQLGVQALSIANQSPQTILSLFR